MSESIHLPKELLDQPALELCWKGLAASIAAGVLTRRQAYEMIEVWEADEESDRRSECYGTELCNLNSES